MKGEIKKHCIPQVIFLQVFNIQASSAARENVDIHVYIHIQYNSYMYTCVHGLPRIQTALEKPFYDVTDTAWLIIYYLLINHQNHHSVQTKFSIQEKESIPLGFKSTGVTL